MGAMNEKVYQLVDENYGFVFEPELVEEIARIGNFQRIKAGMVLMDVGEAFVGMPLLLSGALKIIRENHDGDEILLYYLERGDTCAMSFSCCMGDKKSKVRAVAEEDSEIVMIPVEYMDQWLSKYGSWKSYVFESLQVRMDEFIESIDSIAFLRMDERLLKYLRDKARVVSDPVLHMTHQEIAYDLNTSRVVVSRLMKKLENAGYVKAGRNQLEVLKL